MIVVNEQGSVNKMAENLDVARLAVFDYMVDTLLDLADPEPSMIEDVREDMMQAVQILIEGLGLSISAIDDDGVISATMVMGEAAQ